MASMLAGRIVFGVHERGKGENESDVDKECEGDLFGI